MSKSQDPNFDDFDDKNERINSNPSSSPTDCSDIDDPLISELTDDSPRTNTNSPPQAETNNDDQNHSSNSVLREPDLERKEEISNFNGSEGEGEEEENSNTVSNGDSSGIEEVKKAATPQEALEEIQNQKTHNLYCTNCYHNITTKAILIIKNEETYPYNQNHLVIKIPLFILLPWRTRKSTENDDKGKTNPNLILSRIVDKSKQVFSKMRCSSLSFLSLWFLLVLTLLLLSTIVLWSPQTHVIAQNTGENIRRWFLSLFIYAPTLSLLLVLSLLILAILAQLWPSISFNRKIKENTTDDQNQSIVSANVNPSLEKQNIHETKTNGSNKDEEQPALGPSAGPASEPAQGPAEGPAQGPSQGPAQGPTQGPAQGPAQGPDQGPDPGTNDFIPIINKPAWETTFDVIKQIIPRDLDILKSIVYGGLMESITSLGVVSSAAASGASTLNVLALGLANLFSGLFLIIHNLREKGEDRYKNLIGDKKNWKRHYVVVVFSFIFFGVIPPLFYCLSFKRTDKGHHKAAIVLVASLVCVVILSFAKAHAFKMGRLNTMITYIGMAIGASSISFIVTHLVSDLLEKNGFHELASDFRRGECQDLGSGDAA